MSDAPIRPTIREPFRGDPRLVQFVMWLADCLDSDFTVVDYGFDGREYVIDYEDGTSIVFPVRVGFALHDLHKDASA